MATTQKKTLSLLAYFCKCYPKQSAIILIALVCAGAAEAIGIGALLPLISTMLESENSSGNVMSNITNKIYAVIGLEPTLLNLLTLIVIAITLKSAVIFHAMRYVSYVSADVARDLRMQLIQALMKAKWSYFSSLPVGKISNTISMEAERAGHFYMLSGRMMAAAIQAAVYLAAAFITSWKISLLAIVIGIVAVFCLKRLVALSRKAGQELTKSSNEMLSHLNESITGVKALKAMGQEERYIEYLRQDTTSVMNARKKQALSSLLLQIIYEPLAVLLLAAGLFFILSYTAASVASVILLAFLFYRLLNQANQIQSFYQNMTQNESATWQTMEEISKANNDKENASGTQNITLTDRIEFNSLSISYENGKNIFQKFENSIPAKKLTVIFGPSGIGKSTLLDAVLGLITPQEGNISIDGTNLHDIDIEQWRQQVGYVPQETFLFHDTILANVTLGNEEITEEQVTTALQKSNAWEFIQNIEDGLHHIVGERGGKLSGGQKQRIALARALVRNPSLLILDEATSGLDKESETRILNTLQNMASDITIIAISHDPKILDIADHVIKLEKDNN